MAADQKRARAESAWLVVFDESAVSLIPPVRCTWSPRGRTPGPAPPHGLEEGLDGRRARLLARGHQGQAVPSPATDSYDTDGLIGVLEQLAGFYAGHKVVLLWDGLSAHWSYRMRGHLDAQRDWLTVERLPAYAPELNPAEYLWANLKGAELANFAGDTLVEVADQAHHGIQRVCDSDSLVMGFLAHTGLSLNDQPSP
jgi:hypothetical protein